MSALPSVRLMACVVLFGCLLGPAFASDKVIVGQFDVGGHKLFARCLGTGGPTIIYFHGDHGSADSAMTVPSFISRNHRICAYSRANTPNSDSVPGPVSGEMTASDLHNLLKAIDEPPPYVLLGASLGGLVAYQYLMTYPGEVEAMLLLDASFPDELKLDPLWPADERMSYEDWRRSPEKLNYLGLYESTSALRGHEPKIPVTYLMATPPNEWQGISPEYDAVVLDTMRAYVSSFSPGIIKEIQSEHWMENGAPEKVAKEMETLLASLPKSPESKLTGRLLFSRFDESIHTFLSTHISEPDGSGETEIAMPGPEGGGRWSTSGDAIAVMTVLDDGRIGSAIVSPDGVVQRVLAIPDASLNLPCTVWSPDDSRLACEGWDESDPSRVGIYTVRASDGGDLVRLTEAPPNMVDMVGSYSPDGTKFLFKRTIDESPGRLMVVPTAGGRASAISDLEVEDPGRYSPDGTTILTSSNGHLVLLDTSGHEIGRIEQNGSYLFGAVWSPDGEHIAYSGASAGPFSDIYTSRSDGTDRHRVTSTVDNEIRVEWGRD